MAAYLIAEHLISDPQRFEECRSKGVPPLARFGGRFLSGGGSHEVRCSC